MTFPVHPNLRPCWYLSRAGGDMTVLRRPNRRRNGQPLPPFLFFLVPFSSPQFIFTVFSYEGHLAMKSCFADTSAPLFYVRRIPAPGLRKICSVILDQMRLNFLEQLIPCIPFVPWYFFLINKELSNKKQSCATIFTNDGVHVL